MRKVLVTGNFDILHPGHLRLLRFAKKCGEKLIVGVNSDAISGSLLQVDQATRLESVSSISFVDEAILLNENTKALIERIKPDFVVKGKEFQGKWNEETEALSKHGGKIIFSSGDMNFHYVLTPQIKPLITNEKKRILKTYMDRHKVDGDRLSEIVTKFSQKKVCVIGDLIVDQYIDCFPVGMSQEEPTLVVTPTETKNFLGGAGIVAAHAASLGAETHFFTIAGNDLFKDFASKTLTENNVISYLLTDKKRPTPLKQRFRSDGKSLLRVNNLLQQSLDSDQQMQILEKISTDILKYDVIVFSDFNYGCLPTSLINEIIKIARKHNIIITADSQSSSQIGNILRYRGIDLITPTEREARLALHNSEDGLVVLADEILKTSACKNIILKLGADGLLAQTIKLNENGFQTERIEALNSTPLDPAGAGDSMLITSSLALSCDADLWVASLIGSYAASIQVGRVGNVPISKEELLQVINS